MGIRRPARFSALFSHSRRTVIAKTGGAEIEVEEGGRDRPMAFLISRFFVVSLLALLLVTSHFSQAWAADPSSSPPPSIPRVDESLEEIQSLPKYQQKAFLWLLAQHSDRESFSAAVSELLHAIKSARAATELSLPDAPADPILRRLKSEIQPPDTSPAGLSPSDRAVGNWLYRFAETHPDSAYSTVQFAETYFKESSARSRNSDPIKESSSTPNREPIVRNAKSPPHIGEPAAPSEKGREGISAHLDPLPLESLSGKGQDLLDDLSFLLPRLQKLPEYQQRVFEFIFDWCGNSDDRIEEAMSLYRRTREVASTNAVDKILENWIFEAAKRNPRLKLEFELLKRGFSEKLAIAIQWPKKAQRVLDGLKQKYGSKYVQSVDLWLRERNPSFNSGRLMIKRGENRLALYEAEVHKTHDGKPYLTFLVEDKDMLQSLQRENPELQSAQLEEEEQLGARYLKVLVPIDRQDFRKLDGIHGLKQRMASGIGQVKLERDRVVSFMPSAMRAGIFFGGKGHEVRFYPYRKKLIDVKSDELISEREMDERRKVTVLPAMGFIEPEGGYGFGQTHVYVREEPEDELSLEDTFSWPQADKASDRQRDLIYLRISPGDGPIWTRVVLAGYTEDGDPIVYPRSGDKNGITLWRIRDPQNHLMEVRKGSDPELMAADGHPIDFLTTRNREVAYRYGYLRLDRTSPGIVEELPSALRAASVPGAPCGWIGRLSAWVSKNRIAGKISPSRPSERRK